VGPTVGILIVGLVVVGDSVGTDVGIDVVGLEVDGDIVVGVRVVGAAV